MMIQKRRPFAVSVFALICAASLMMSSACTKAEDAAPKAKLDLPPGSTAQEIEAAVEAVPSLLEDEGSKQSASELSQVIEAGKRLYAWLAVLNQSRAADRKISFTSKETTKGYPIDDVRPYNVAIIKTNFSQHLAASPIELRDVLMGTQTLPADLPPAITEETFVKWGREIAGDYDIATRWVSLIGDIGYYRMNQFRDMRGYYFLTRLTDRDAKLRGFSTLPASEQEQIREWLVQICMNNQSWRGTDRAACQSQVATAETQQALVQFYSARIKKSEQMWNANFDLDQSVLRRDLTWTSADPTVMIYPFLAPQSTVITDYLRFNIEDEFKTPGWSLKLNFVSNPRRAISRIEFKKGETPHAIPSQGLIVMDANQPTTEYDSQWVIRHEFGHLLGFVDCYVEFYDESIQAMVNYQLDTTDMMCSRRGIFQPHHFDRLKAAYYR